MDQPPAPPPDALFEQLRGHERQLFGALCWSRVAVVAGLGVILPDERSLHGHLFTTIVAGWAVLAVWTLAGALLARRLFDLLRDRPVLVAADGALFAILMCAGGGWRNPFYLYFWSIAGLVSIFLGARATLIVTGGGCALQLAAFGLGASLLSDPAARNVRLSDWPAPVVGYLVIGLGFWYVRCRFDDLAAAAAAYRAEAESAVAAERAASVARERSAIAFRLHDRVRQALPAMRLRLATMPGGEPETIELERLIDGADGELDAIFEELRHT